MIYGVIYGLYDPRIDELRYIGQTTKTLKQRLHGHTCKHNLARHLYSSRWIIHLRRLGLNPLIKQLAEAGSREELDSLEIQLIAEAKACGKRLTNITNGGEGLIGYKHKAETKAKISAAHKGKPKSAEMKEKLSVARKGKKLSKETKQKVSAALMGRIVSEETRAKLRNKKLSAEAKAKIGAANRGVCRLSDEAKARISAANTGRKHSAEAKAKIAAAGKMRTPRRGFHLADETKAKLRGPRPSLQSENNLRYYHNISTDLILHRFKEGASRKQVAKELGRHSGLKLLTPLFNTLR